MCMINSLVKLSTLSGLIVDTMNLNTCCLATYFPTLGAVYVQ